MLNGTIKIVAIILGVLWTIAAIPPVINTYYVLKNNAICMGFIINSLQWQ